MTNKVVEEVEIPSNDNKNNSIHSKKGDKSSTQTAIGRWTEEEHQLFLEAVETFPYRAWKKIATKITTRTVVQIRTHAQKYYQKLSKSEGRDLVSMHSNEPTAEEDIQDDRSRALRNRHLKRATNTMKRKTRTQITKRSEKKILLPPPVLLPVPTPVMPAPEHDYIPVELQPLSTETKTKTHLMHSSHYPYECEIQYLQLPPMVKELEDLNDEETLEWFTTSNESQSTSMDVSSPESSFFSDSENTNASCYESFVPLDLDCGDLENVYRFAVEDDVLDPDTFVTHFFGTRELVEYGINSI